MARDLLSACTMRAGFLGVFVLVLGCGGATTNIGGGDASADQSASDQSASDVTVDTSLSASCPASPPTEGQSCSLSEGFQCEYGTKFWAFCDQLYACTGGAWHTMMGFCPGEENADCPSSFSQITAGADCTAQSKSNETCNYAQGACQCEGFCGGAFMPDAGITWKCDAPDPGCPSERPRFGSTCTGNATCNYDICCAGSTMQCQNGTWQGNTLIGGCP